MNLTDVGHMTEDAGSDGGGEDKMAAARDRLLESKKAGVLPEGAPADFDPSSPWDIARFYAGAFSRDARMLGLRVAEEAEVDASLMPRATDRMGAMLRLIVELIEKGHAYVSGEAVYFDVGSFGAYGRLSGNTPEMIRAGAGGRVSESSVASKRHPADFLLWKHDPRHVMRWDPREVLGDDDGWGERAAAAGLREGYPGWHAECSAMARERLGDVIDIHSGGEDLIFPHHECEIAQSRCVTGREVFSRYWVHTRFLKVEGEKMSKSAGNFFTARQVMERGFGASALRLALIGSHYRQNANFTERGLKDAAGVVARWRRFLSAAEGRGEDGPGEGGLGEGGVEAARSFARSMNDDVNVAGAVAAVNRWVKEEGEPGAAEAALMRVFDGVLGVLELSDEGVGGGDGGGGGVGEEDARIDALVEARRAARAARDFGEADRIRDELDALGVEVTDTADGPVWTRRAAL